MTNNSILFATDTYDLLISTGCLVPAHIKEDCFEELIRVTKKGMKNDECKTTGMFNEKRKIKITQLG